MDRSQPSERQRFVLQVIDEAVRTRGRAPTIRELMAALDMASTNGPADHLRVLERKGFITRQKNQARTVRLTPKALALIGASPMHRCPHCGGSLNPPTTSGEVQ